MNFEEFMYGGGPAAGRTGAQVSVPYTPIPTQAAPLIPQQPISYPGQGLVEERSAQWYQQWMTKGQPVTPLMEPYTPAPQYVTAPTGPGQVPVVTTTKPAIPQVVPPPSPTTSPLQTSVTEVPGLDMIRNLLIAMVVLQFLQMFGGLAAGFAGGAAAGLIRR